MNYKSIVVSLVCLLLASCTVTMKHVDGDLQPQSRGALVAPASSNASGSLIYSLPKTSLHFVVTSEKIEKKRGVFYLYSERFLGLTDVILQDATEWNINDVSLQAYGVANDDEMYQIFSDNSDDLPLLQLAEDGVVLSVNSPASPVERPVQCNINVANEVGIVPYTEAMLLANSTAKMAEEAARYIYQLRESRTALLTSDLDALPPDGQAYAMSLAKIDELENQFLSLFQGSKTITTVTDVIEFTPDQIVEKEVLFRFSSFAGVVAKDDLSGSPVFISMEAKEFKSLHASVTDTAGFFCKRPAPIQISLASGVDQLLDEKVYMGQFGEVQSLPLGTLNDKVKIQFNPATGALKSIMK